MLLALALTVLVLALVSGVLTNYSRMTTAGRVEAERARLAQSLLRSIERDIRSVVYRPSRLDTGGAVAGQAADTSGGQANSQSPTGAGQPTADATNQTNPATTPAPSPAGAVAGSEVGLFGDSTSLVLHVSRPTRDLNYLPVSEGLIPGARTSDLLSVSWFLAVANAGGLQGAAGNIASGGSAMASRDTGAQGLSRLVGDRLALQLADAAGDTAGMAAESEVVAKEVNQLQFRYFDGIAWQEAWDSAAYGGLPRAVEILIGFRDPEGPNDSATEMRRRLGAEESAQVFRLVVSLPAAPPDAAAF